MDFYNDMDTADTLINKVAQSGLITLDPLSFMPGNKRLVLDIAPFLWNNIAVKEKEFRTSLKNLDVTEYAGADVCMWCSQEDALIPQWAWMLMVERLSTVAASVIFCNPVNHSAELLQLSIRNMDVAPYVNQKVILKGCAQLDNPAAVFTQLTSKLLPVVQTLMFGEACSAVPVYKRRN